MDSAVSGPRATPPAAAGPDDFVPEQESGTGVLADLIAAGLVSHEVIGDPERLGGETACLKALCALVSGPVYRIDAYHYALRATDADLGGKLGQIAPGRWAEALGLALTETLGAEAVWVTATDLMPEADGPLAQPLLLVSAYEEAVREGVSTAGADIQAVINARFAVRCARLVTELAMKAEGQGGLGERLGALEARQSEISAAIEARDHALSASLSGLSDTLATILSRLEAQAESLGRHAAGEARLAEAVESLGESGSAGAAVGFQETLGVTLAEFLARIERSAEEDRVARRLAQIG